MHGGAMYGQHLSRDKTQLTKTLALGHRVTGPHQHSLASSVAISTWYNDTKFLVLAHSLTTAVRVDAPLGNSKNWDMTPWP